MPCSSCPPAATRATRSWRSARRGGAACVTVAMVGYDGGRVADERPGGPRGGHALGAHPAHPGGAGQRLARAARAAGALRHVSTPGRVSARVEGVVQGVGFRPYVHRLAGELGLAGFVLNDERGVLIEVEGEAGGAAAASRSALPAEAPPLARVEQRPDRGAGAHRRARFAIRDSRRGAEPDARVSPDARHLRRLPARAVRSRGPPPPLPVHQLHQLRPALHHRARGALRPPDHHDGRLPDVRPRCQAEYDDPADRRFHAQPNACPDCGPGACDSARDRGCRPGRGRGRSGRGRGAGGEGARRVSPGLSSGAGAGGGGAAGAQAPRGPAVRADGADPWRRRARWCISRPRTSALLVGRERPIVIARRREGAAVADSVAPRSRTWA